MTGKSPREKGTMESRFVFKKKRDEHGRVSRYKARLMILQDLFKREASTTTTSWKKFMIYTDDQAAIKIIEDHAISDMTKYIDIRYHFIRELSNYPSTTVQRRI